jgi:hypothetical protein
MLHQGPNNYQILASPQQRLGVGEPGSSSARTWSKGWRVAGGRTTPSDDRQAGGPVNDEWPRADDAGWRHEGGRGRTDGRGWTTSAGGTRVAEDGRVAMSGRCRLEARGRPWTDGRSRANDGGWPEEARAAAPGARQPMRWRSRRPV